MTTPAYGTRGLQHAQTAEELHDYTFLTRFNLTRVIQKILDFTALKMIFSIPSQQVKVEDEEITRKKTSKLSL